ncbi:trehalose-phosphatase [Tateyamaria omphalii]|uniref:trehalose-phosphatase n=1 Tax=Tateyamaria omphalii TaxID=299262 RepID=UPI001560F404|nr:trehalose-phosphatase [Tateyamaria omphalii]
MDFDGTLVDLAPTPDSIHIPDTLPALLTDLQGRAGGALVLISGRAAGDLAHWLPDFSGLIVGGHGAEWRQGGTVQPRVDVAPDSLAMLRDAASAFAGTTPSILLEEKPTGLVLHYRAQPDLQDRVETFTADLSQTHTDFEAHPAKMAIEMRPRGVGKDLAMADVMALEPYAGRTPVMIGDDTTDEPAMAWAQKQGGLGIKVGTGDTNARHRLPDTLAVHRLLKHWP